MIAPVKVVEALSVAVAVAVLSRCGGGGGGLLPSCIIDDGEPYCLVLMRVAISSVSSASSVLWFAVASAAASAVVTMDAVAAAAAVDAAAAAAAAAHRFVDSGGSAPLLGAIPPCFMITALTMSPGTLTYKSGRIPHIIGALVSANGISRSSHSDG